MIHKGDKFNCYCVGGDEIQQDCGEFEIVTLTNKTCKLKEIRKSHSSTIERFYRINKDTKKLNRYITMRSKENMGDFIKEEFIKYDTGCGMPFTFKKIYENKYNTKT